MIVDVPDSECNAVSSFWKGRLADPEIPLYESSRVEKSKSRANAFYRRAVDLDIERMVEAGDQSACTCIGEMYHHEWGMDVRYSTAVKWCRKAAEQGHAIARFILGFMYHFGHGVDENDSTETRPC